MALPNLSGAGRLTNDPELRYTPSGTAVCRVPLAFNSRRLNQASKEWEDGDTLFLEGVLWKDAAEAAAEHLKKGQEVAVTGRPKTRQWQTSDGQKRSAIELLIDSIGPTLRTLTKPANRDKPAEQKADGDPWAVPAGANDEPPF